MEGFRGLVSWFSRFCCRERPARLTQSNGHKKKVAVASAGGVASELAVVMLAWAIRETTIYGLRRLKRCDSLLWAVKTQVGPGSSSCGRGLGHVSVLSLGLGPDLRMLNHFN